MALREVRLEYRGVNTYLVEADDDESAEMIARQRYAAGDDGESTGSEWSHVEGVTIERPDFVPDGGTEE